MPETILIYVPTLSSRIVYAFDLIFKELLGTGYTFTISQFDFILAAGPKISYNQRRITKEEFFISCHTLLFEKNIQPQLIHCYSPRNGYKAFFKGNGDTDFPFDIFAAAFYLLSRYEEYLPHEKDLYGRFPAEDSLAYKEGFLKDPVINIWAEDFKNMLKKRFPGLDFRLAHFQFTPTYDIDTAYKYLNRGGIAALMAAWKSKGKDPYDCYEWLDKLHGEFQADPVYFFLVGEGGEYDKNITPGHPVMQELIKASSSKYATGVHPSWRSNEDNGQLRAEKQLLEAITGKAVTGSRQHYLKLEFPVTYQQLVAAGITDDYSMGYSDRNGFRAGICNSFLWYDLSGETATALGIHPFCFMDTAAFYHLHYSPAQALHELFQLAEVVKKVNGEMITLFHNESLGTDRQWKGWREAYEEFVKTVVKG